jgi:hypothetical protein
MASVSSTTPLIKSLRAPCISGARTPDPSPVVTDHQPVAAAPPSTGSETLRWGSVEKSLLHHCEVVSVSGNRSRLKNRLQATGRDTDVA